MPATKLRIGDTLQAMRHAFEQHRPFLVRLTVAFAATNAIASLLDIAGAAGLAISFGITILLGASYSGMVTALLCLPGSGDSAGELWNSVKPVLARLIWVTLLTAVAVGVGIAALIIPGLVLVTIWAVAGQSVVVERKAVFAALGRSYELVRNNAWQTFGYLVVIGLLSLVLLGVALLIAAPFGTALAGQLIANFLINLLSTPVLAIGSAVLYNALVELQEPAHPSDPPPADPVEAPADEAGTPPEPRP